jgi:hypothetical protein
MVSLSGPPDGGTKFGFIITEKERVKGEEGIRCPCKKDNDQVFPKRQTNPHSNSLSVLQILCFNYGFITAE